MTVTVVAAAERPRDVELQPGMLVEVLEAMRRACRRARGLVEFGLGNEQAHRIGEVAGIARVALGQGFAFSLVAVQQRRRRLALDDAGELPAQVHRILDRRVVPQPPGRREQMGGIASDEDAAPLQPPCHEGMPREPRAHGQDSMGTSAPTACAKTRRASASVHASASSQGAVRWNVLATPSTDAANARRWWLTATYIQARCLSTDRNAGERR
jgi:hypothetical protein